mmetsp:Transcript_10/g.26  ORF Transcript_10/g.26 Transcript_10/m.26 type:complete len:400 (-) Transcript_10:2726-3925(-)
MQIKLIRDDFDAKEAQWKKALRIGHTKYLKAKEDNKRLTTIIEDRDKDIKFYAERAKVDESTTNLLQEQISVKDDLIKDLEKEISELKDKIEISEANIKESDKRREILESKVSDHIEQLSSAQDKVKQQEEQLSLAKLQLTKLGNRWKTRREEMQGIIENKSQEIISLREQYEIMKAEKISLEDSLRSAREEIDLLRRTNITNETIAEESQAEEKSWIESVEIASAAVKQAEEREKKLKQELDHVLKRENDAKEAVNKLTNRLQVLQALEEQSKSTYYEASKDYMSQIQAMKNEIAEMTRRLEAAENYSLVVKEKTSECSEQTAGTLLREIDVGAKLVGNITNSQVKKRTASTKLEEESAHDNVLAANDSGLIVTKKSNGRIYRLVRRIKSIWRKDCRH